MGQAGLGVGGLPPPTSGTGPRASHPKAALQLLDLAVLIVWRKKIPTLLGAFLFGELRMHFRQVLPCGVAGEGQERHNMLEEKKKLTAALTGVIAGGRPVAPGGRGYDTGG